MIPIGGTPGFDQREIMAFEYSAEWLNSGFSISPLSCRWAVGVFIANHVLLKEAMAVFRETSITTR
jgi:hypothetical protein